MILFLPDKLDNVAFESKLPLRAKRGNLLTGECVTLFELYNRIRQDHEVPPHQWRHQRCPAARDQYYKRRFCHVADVDPNVWAKY